MKMETKPQADPGDDSVVMRVHLPWVDTVQQVLPQMRGVPVGTVLRQPNGQWELAFSLDRGPGGRQRYFVAIDPDGTRSDCWRLLRLGPGVWDLDPSLHVPGQIHAFLTLLNVPEPAPWT